VPFHRRSQFLNGRDLTGELVAAAKKRNMRVIARFSPDLNWGDALEAHPEWFKRDRQGKAIPHNEDDRLYETCTFTSYMTEHMPALMREVNSRYAIDGFFTNAWPPIGRMPECYCEACIGRSLRSAWSTCGRFGTRLQSRRGRTTCSLGTWAGRFRVGRI
jgi:hypothetical protein